jgi:DUF1365 family protein
MHRRNTPTVHAFSQRLSMVWIDPDTPEELFARHWLASSTGPAPLRFRPSDYGTPASPLGSQSVRDELAPVLGRSCDGPVRMLTQPRRWGWLFSPLTLYFAWPSEGAGPIGVVAEVTNTPWKERHRYAVALEGDGDIRTASFAKTMHVSPFLDTDHTYLLRLESSGSRLRIDLDVVTGDQTTVLETRLVVEKQAPTARNVRRFALADPLATYRVSTGIHLNAARLWRKKVPFVAHPDATQRPKRKVSA